MQKSIESFLAGRKRPVEERAGAASTSKRQCHDDSDASLTPEENVWLDDNVSDFDSDITDEENVDGDVSVVSTPSVSTVGVKPSLTPPGPKDISAGRSDNPMQPKLSAFPTTQFGMKRRSFSPRWYEVYPWLEYSVSQDAAFCFCCRLFPLPGKSIAETVFTVSGYRQWKKATEKDSGFAQHERSDYHNSAFCAWKDFRSYIETGKAIDVALVSAHDKQVQENRHYIKQVAKVLCLTARQKIAQRGHREDIENTNRGNFLEILDFISEHDDIVKQRLTGLHRIKYTSPEIQNEILEILANMIRDKISKELHSSTYYSVMVDESKDVSGKEQLSVGGQIPLPEQHS